MSAIIKSDIWLLDPRRRTTLDYQDLVEQHGPFWAEGFWSFEIGLSIDSNTEQSNLWLQKTLRQN